MQESKKLDKYIDFARELKKYVESDGDSDTAHIWSTRNNFKVYRKASKEIHDCEEEFRPGRAWLSWDRLEYEEESWRVTKTCCHLVYSEGH